MPLCEIAVLPGDSIGPEVVESNLCILEDSYENHPELELSY